MRSERLDGFEDVSSWQPVASGLAELKLSSERSPQPAMRLDFDFKGGGGFVVARKAVSRSLPDSFALSFAIRGAAPANRLELKLADPSGRNVWWRTWDPFPVPADWQTVTVSSHEIEFAWGPAGGGPIGAIGAIELVVAARAGGAGTISIADLRLEDRTYRGTPAVRATSAQPGHPAAHALDGDLATSWRSASGGAAQALTIDFGEEREYGGFVVRWAAGAEPRTLSVETSGDGAVWSQVHAAQPAGVATSYLFLPGTSRWLRFVVEPGPSGVCGIADVAVRPFEFSRSPEAFFEEIARTEPAGRHPRWLAGEQSFWTPIGLPDGTTSAIMNEDGLVEIDRGTFSVEPFLSVDGRLVTWADAERSVSLADGWIPVPTSHWCAGDLSLETTAFAARSSGRPTLYLHYRVASRAVAPQRIQFFAAVRPFQVNPPWQRFGALGGTRRIESIAWDGRAVVVDGTRALVPWTEPSGFGAAPFEQGEITTWLARGTLPPSPTARDAFGYASGALGFAMELAPGEAREVVLAAPFGEVDAATAGAIGAELRRDDDRGGGLLAAVLDDWRARLGGIRLALPPVAADHAATARTAAAQVLVNRDGPALQPGPRRYTRSWIRDGAIMAAALLRMGRVDEAFEFARWYASFQRADGNVPCCVDRSGPDWLPEHDSHGQLVFLVMECFRFRRDRAFLAELWPAVRRAIDYLEALRAERLGPEYESDPALGARYGLLPESASHEGYLAHPVHSYWDDFWALQGYRDAAAMAAILGEERDARRLTEIADAFREAIRQSIERTIAERQIRYVPGSVEWADFDPTATAHAVGLLGLGDLLPPAALAYTFDEYLAGFRRRRDGAVEWNNYSAYEVRIAGALVCLGRRDEAAELLAFLLHDRRPPAWNQWPEITWREPRSPGHLGDVPHTWIGAEYVLAFRMMLAWERRADRALVLGAGIPSTWLDGGAEVRVERLPTHWGTLDFRLRRERSGAIAFSLSGDLEVPPGGIVLVPPLRGPLESVDANGAALRSFDDRGATIGALPAEVVLRSSSSG